MIQIIKFVHIQLHMLYDPYKIIIYCYMKIKTLSKIFLSIISFHFRCIYNFRLKYSQISIVSIIFLIVPYKTPILDNIGHLYWDIGLFCTINRPFRLKVLDYILLWEKFPHILIDIYWRTLAFIDLGQLYLY